MSHESDDPTKKAAIANSGDDELIARVMTHLGTEYVNMSKDVAAQFDTGDLYDSDPRIRASLKITGEETGRKRKI